MFAAEKNWMWEGGLGVIVKLFVGAEGGPEDAACGVLLGVRRGQQVGYN
jgi:hypothetical protein